MIFDVTHLRGAKISPNSGDPWSVLRRNYTGTMFFFHLVLLVAFTILYISKTLLWVGVNRSQVAFRQSVEAIKDHALQIELSPIRELILNATSGITNCLAPECVDYSVRELIIGMDKGGYVWMLVLALIVYNILRAALTMIVQLPN